MRGFGVLREGSALYVRLKHALSQLTLRAASLPRDAGFVAWLAAYAHLAAAGEAHQETTVRREALRLAHPAGWVPSQEDLAVVIRARLLWRRAGRLALAGGYRPYWTYFRTQVQRLFSATRFLLDPPPAPEPAGSTYRGLVLFDFGLFFACHEHFEGMWRQSAGPDRSFYQGLVQLAAAFYHHEKGNRHGAVTLLRRATQRLAQHRPASHGLDIDALLAQLEPWEGRFAAGQPGPYPVLVAGQRPEAVR